MKITHMIIDVITPKNGSTLIRIVTAIGHVKKAIKLNAKNTKPMIVAIANITTMMIFTMNSNNDVIFFIFFCLFQ